MPAPTEDSIKIPYICFDLLRGALRSMGINGNALPNGRKNLPLPVRRPLHAASGISGPENATTPAQTLRAYVHYVNIRYAHAGTPSQWRRTSPPRGCVSRKHLLYTFLALHPESGTLNLLRETPVTRGGAGGRGAEGVGGGDEGEAKRTPWQAERRRTAAAKIKGTIKGERKKSSGRRGGGRARSDSRRRRKPTLARRPSRARTKH